MAQNASPHRREPGGVLAEDNNLYGTGVNVVARLEQLAVLGGICVSQTVYDQVRKIVEIPFQDIGARRPGALKNTGPNGQDVATLEVDYYPGVTPKLGKWNFDIATYYVAYPGAFDPNGNFDYFELWSGVSRSLFDDKLEIKLQLLVARLFRRDR